LIEGVTVKAWTLPGVLAALMLAGCSSGGTPDDPTVAPTPAASAGLGDRGEPSKAPSQKVTREITASFAFSTPSRNIGCYVSSDSARCDIQKKTWTAPPKPADCDLDFGNGVAVVKTEKATVVCAGDTVPGAKEVLEYGEVVRVGSFLCDSESSGVRCTNEDSGHGFTVSRQAYTLF
jgi:hypothetical protein